LTEVGYEVVGVLGRGGSAVVELALDGNGSWVATKRVALTGSATQLHVARQRLRREAEILRNLAHPGIVPIIDVIDDGSDVVLVFPPFHENLEDRVSRLGPLPPGEVARIGRVLLAALADAHRYGVVHRDIKPANVLFNEAGEPALSDFGVAVTRDVTAGLTPAGTVVGTPMWMAPEQARGDPAGPASDVFALAATLRFAATGRGPYLPGPASTVMARAAHREIEPLPASVRDPLRAALESMLDPRPERRPSAAAVIGGLDGTTVTPIPRPHRWTAAWGAAAPSSESTDSRPATGARGRVASAASVVRGRVRPWAARLLGDPVDRRALHPHRRRVLAVAAGVLATAGAAGVVAVGLSAGTPAPPAPHTSGKGCVAGWYNLDGMASIGCEAHSDYVAGTVLAAGSALHANVVPQSAADSFRTHVSGDALNFCWGALHVTLTAPPQTAERLTVWHGTTKVAEAMSADGAPATATVSKPSCFGADSADLQVIVTVVAATGGASAQDFTLTRDGGW
jgi:hypothetical protein